MKNITVVIPNYNGKKYIEECLHALYNQDPDTPKYSVLIVDNASQDGSLQIIKEQFPQAELVALEENTGFCHAVNLGIQHSDSEFIILLNNDTKVKSGFIKNLYRAISRDEKIFAVSSKMLMWDRPELVDDAGDRYCVLGWAFSRGKGKETEKYENAVEIFAACGGAAIYRKSVFAEIGLFDEAHFAYLEDIDIGYRAKIFGYSSFYEPEAQVLHYGSASTGSRYNERKTLLAAANSIYLIGKNMPFLQWLWNSPFLLVGFAVKFLFFCRKGMGRLYLKGLGQGLRKLFTEQGRQAKVPFQMKHLKNYFAIQWQLYCNLFRLFCKR